MKRILTIVIVVLMAAMFPLQALAAAPSNAAKHSATKSAIGFTTTQSITKTSSQTWGKGMVSSVYVLWGDPAGSAGWATDFWIRAKATNVQVKNMSFSEGGT